MTDQTPILRDYALSDRYTKTTGRVFMTGTQAIVRMALDQARRDKAAGLDTRGYVSGYRGSPVGGIDLEIGRNLELVKDAGVTFLPAVNEEFGATQMIGTQQVETDPHKTCEAVFGLWYGKGPGVDRAGDALKHGNAYGASPNGGVLVVAGGVLIHVAPVGRGVYELFHARSEPCERGRIPAVCRMGLCAVALFGNVGWLQGDLGNG